MQSSIAAYRHKHNDTTWSVLALWETHEANAMNYVYIIIE